MTIEVPDWHGADLRELLALERIGDRRFRTTCVDPNAHDRVFGGQLLALVAAASDVPPGRGSKSGCPTATARTCTPRHLPICRTGGSTTRRSAGISPGGDTARGCTLRA